MVRSLLFIICFLTCASQIYAQFNPTLNIQGILKKSDGVAIEDGVYSLTFKLYTVSAGVDPAIWTEMQPAVAVSSGIYSTTLGSITPLTLSFNQLYYLGVTVGAGPMELTPRTLLTSAPYALSLIGQSNSFPSTGLVKADSIVVKGGILADGGVPGANGANKNGYAFSGNGGDNDSGLFSTANGKVALYGNNVEVLTVTPTNVQANFSMGVNGDVTTNNLALPSSGSVVYNGLSDWRLVETNNFSSTAEGWQVYDKLSGQNMGWNNSASSGPSNTVHWGGFAGDALLPGNNDYVLKKGFNLSGVGPFTEVMVKFRYYFIDSWGWGGGDRSWAAFATSASGNGIRVAWDKIHSFINDGNGDFNTSAFKAASDIQGLSDYSDNWNDVEITQKATSTTFWVFIGAAVDEAADNETFAVGAVEIYVR